MKNKLPYSVYYLSALTGNYPRYILFVDGISYSFFMKVNYSTTVGFWEEKDMDDDFKPSNLKALIRDCPRWTGFANLPVD
jgi:hypothetical protein